MLRVFGKDGRPYDITQGIGLGIRQHDDVMLSWGYSHKVSKIVTIPANDFAVITLTIPEELNHHAEKRFLEAYNGILDIKIIIGLEEANLPSVVNQIPAFNQKGPYLNEDVQSIFHWRGTHASNPITGVAVTDQNILDELHLHGTTGNSRTAGEATSSAVQGRYYTEGIWTVLFENKSNANVELTYIYDWHEFN